jgi:hypothetical protein
MSTKVNWDRDVLGRFLQDMAERDAADWSRKRTFVLTIADHEFDDVNHVCEYVTPRWAGHVYVRRADTAGDVLVDVCDPDLAGRFWAYVVANMGVEEHNLEFVTSIREVAA